MTHNPMTQDEVLAVLRRRESRTFAAWKQAKAHRDRLDGPERDVAHVRAQEAEQAWVAAKSLADTIAAWNVSPSADATTTCHNCGAPCREVVLMRGGDNGWGDDASRTVCRYVSPSADVVGRLPPGVYSDAAIAADYAAQLAQQGGESKDAIDAARHGRGVEPPTTEGGHG